MLKDLLYSSYLLPTIPRVSPTSAVWTSGCPALFATIFHPLLVRLESDKNLSEKVCLLMSTSALSIPSTRIPISHLVISEYANPIDDADDRASHLYHSHIQKSMPRLILA